MRLVPIPHSPAPPKVAQIPGVDFAYFFFKKSHRLPKSHTFIGWPKSGPKTQALLAEVGSILGRFWALRTGVTVGPQIGPLLPGILPGGRLGGQRFWGPAGRPILSSPALRVQDVAQDAAQLRGAQIGPRLCTATPASDPKTT